jgi:hypothetical protein
MAFLYIRVNEPWSPYSQTFFSKRLPVTGTEPVIFLLPTDKPWHFNDGDGPLHS